MLVWCCLLLLGAPASHAAVKADPVYVAINRAAARHEITAIQAVQLRATWKLSASAARNAPSATRRQNVNAVRQYTASLARSGQLTGPRLGPALLSVKATSWAMRSRDSFPSHEEEVTVPGEVVAFTYYAGHGLQFQPFETFKQGMRELNQDEPDIEAARAIADRMLELDMRRGSSLTWEYYFPWNGGGTTRPWTSAISQALATEFYYRVAELTPADERAPYEQAAAAITRSFLRSTTIGGVAVGQGKGRFYVMYSFAPRQRILNGHLQALLNVNRYAEATGSAEARQVVDIGTRAVLPLLPRFDTGAWSYYLPGSEAELGYHELQTSQLVRLGDELHDGTFAAYGARFKQYLETPPKVTFGTQAWQSIIPARDGFRDRIVVRFAVDKRSRVTMVVRDVNGTEQWRRSWWGGRGGGQLAWDGRDSRGHVVSDGAYLATLTSTDVAGNRSVTEVPRSLQVTNDRVAPELRLLSLTEAHGVGVVGVTARDFGSAWIVASVRVHGKVVAIRRGPRAGHITLRTRLPIADLHGATVVLVDSSGNRSTFTL